MKPKWVGVGLDGTLAKYTGQLDGSIGEPIGPMVDRVKKWLAEGRDVRIFTARVAWNGPYVETDRGPVPCHTFIEHQRETIYRWCEEVFGRRLPITATKDFLTEELWDDRAVRVEHNTGKLI